MPASIIACNTLWAAPAVLSLENTLLTIPRSSWADIIHLHQCYPCDTNCHKALTKGFLRFFLRANKPTL